MAVQISANGILYGGGAVLTASDGTKLALIQHDNGAGGAYTVKLYSGVDSTPSTEDSDTAVTIHGAGVVAYGLHAAIDSNDHIHIVSVSSNFATASPHVAYCKATYSAGSWTFGSWETVANFTDDRPVSYPQAQISVDSSDFPHIVYLDRITSKGATADQVMYTERTGGSWATPIQLSARADKTDTYLYPIMSHKGSDNIEVIYTSGGASTPGDLIYQTWNGSSWSGESTYAETAAKPLGVAVDTGGTVRRYHGIDASSLKENNSAIGATPHATVTNNCWWGATLDGTNRYIFYRDSSTDDLYLYSNTGSGWNNDGAVFTGTVNNHAVEWQYYNLNRSGELSFIYEAGSGIYYDTYALAPAERRVFITHA